MVISKLQLLSLPVTVQARIRDFCVDILGLVPQETAAPTTR